MVVRMVDVDSFDDVRNGHDDGRDLLWIYLRQGHDDRDMLCNGRHKGNRMRRN